jgi:hypothetical protein
VLPDSPEGRSRASQFGLACAVLRQGVHSIYEVCVSDDMRMVLAGGVALLLFLVLFAFGQLQEIFRATGYH